MKNRFNLLIIFVLICSLVTLCLASCDKPSDDNNEGGSGEVGGDAGTNGGDNSGNEGGEGGEGGNEGGEGDTPSVRENPCSACPTGEYKATVTVPAKALSDGECIYTCDSCSDSYTEVIPATKSIKVLVIGDASSSDAVKLLEPMLEALGVTDRLICQMNCKFSTGAALDDQWTNISGGRTPYTISYKIGGEEIKDYTQTFDDGLKAYGWDYIVLQQKVGLAGMADSYGHLGDILGYIEENKTNPDCKILWNMTWAFNSASSSADFEYYGEDQMEMYAAIVDTVKEKVLTDSRIDGIIPLGTAVQNMRSIYDTSTSPLVGENIKLDNNSDDFALYLSALAFCRVLTGVELGSVEWTPELESADDATVYKLIKEASINADMNNYEVNAPSVKSVKLLIFGNSYGNDASMYLEKIFRCAGYLNVTIGHVGESAMAINDHYHNIDDDPDNDYIYTNSNGEQYTFSVHYKTVNGVRVELPADYKQILADEPWDYVLFYQGPNNTATLTEAKYYSELDKLIAAFRTYMTNPEGKIVYYMPWAHNVDDTSALYNGIVDITRELIAPNAEIAGVLPAATLIQNLRSSYLKDGAAGDITRDWGHLNYGVGRYALGLLFYSYLTGGDIDEITYIPTENDVSTAQRPYFTDPGENIEVIKEAVKNALKNPFEVTKSVYKEKP